MESEKVKEIKKALKYCSEGKCEKCLIGKKDIRKCVDILLKDTLTLINELESENKSLQDLCNKTYEDLTKEIDRLENRVKELEEDIAKSMLGCEFLPECTNDKLKQFAERLKEKFYYVFGNEYEQSVSGFDTKVLIEHIDETLKEFIKD